VQAPEGEHEDAASAGIERGDLWRGGDGAIEEQDAVVSNRACAVAEDGYVGAGVGDAAEETGEELAIASSLAWKAAPSRARTSSVLAKAASVCSMLFALVRS
jgi:hypothetical protein